MATCKDCLHVEVCNLFYPDDVLAEENAENDCNTFKDRSLYVLRKQPNGNQTKNRYNGSIPIVSISPDGMVTHYPSIKEAAQAVGTSTSLISQAVNFGKPCRGMVWKKAGEYDG